jgi:hypothetical protein
MIVGLILAAIAVGLWLHDRSRRQQAALRSWAKAYERQLDLEAGGSRRERALQFLRGEIGNRR